MLDAVGEHHTADAIVVPNRRHREHRGQLRSDFTLESTTCAEALGARHVDREHHGELALFDVAFDVRPLHARGDVPIDAPHFIARLVLAHLGELHPLPLERRAVLAGEQRVHESPRAKLEELHLPQDFRRHCGTRMRRDGSRLRLLVAYVRVGVGTPALPSKESECHGRLACDSVSAPRHGLSIFASTRCTI